MRVVMILATATRHVAFDKAFYQRQVYRGRGCTNETGSKRPVIIKKNKSQ